MPESSLYRVHPEAWVEIEAADDWYLKRSTEASASFLAAIYDAFESISEAPQRRPRHLYRTRRFVLQRFPFSVIYLHEPSLVNIVAVAHSKRKPGYWKRRV